MDSTETIVEGTVRFITGDSLASEIYFNGKWIPVDADNADFRENYNDIKAWFVQRKLEGDFSHAMEVLDL